MQVIKGKDLKLLLKKKGISQKALSVKTGVVRTSISRYFNDDVVMPYHFLLKVAVMAGLSIDDMVVYDSKELLIAREDEAAYYASRRSDSGISLDNLGSMIREMQRHIEDLQQQVNDLKGQNTAAQPEPPSEKVPPKSRRKPDIR